MRTAMVTVALLAFATLLMAAEPKQSELKTFLYRLTPARLEMVTNGPNEQEAEILEKHGAYLQSLTDRKVILFVGRTQNNDPSVFGVVVFRAASEPEAIEIMNNDPGVKFGIQRAELFPFKVAFESLSK